ncbi:MAG: hypothetical protein ACKVZ6_10550 [Kineosporiaceae bacterium]
MRLVFSQGFAAFDVGGHLLPLWSPNLEPLADHVGADGVLGLRSLSTPQARLPEPAS